MKILAMNYQRNGISGESFIVARIKNIDGRIGDFLVTFQTNDADKEINPHTCRVVELNNVYDNWRGDYISFDIQKLFKATGVKTYYDWLTQFRESAKGSQYYKKPKERKTINAATQ